MTTMTCHGRVGATRRRLLTLPLLAAALAAPAVLPAQGRWTGDVGAPRDSSGLRRQRAELHAQLDSLRRQFEEEPLTLEQRRQLSHQLTSLVMSLAELSRMNVDMKRLRVEASRAAEDAARAATMFGQSTAAWREAKSRGWIGLNVDAPQVYEVRGREQFVRYFDYPQIVSVEPNSPAERAGILAGDELVAYDGADVREHPIDLTRLLRPDVRVRVTVDRDGTRRDFTVRVARAPEPYAMRRMELMASPMPPMPPAMGGMPAMPAMPALPDAAPSPPARAAFRAWQAAPAVDGDAPPTPTMRIFGAPGFSPNEAPVAGAQMLETRDRDLARYFGVQHGLLVTDVVPGPARSSGLRGGDVIVRAGGRNVTSIVQFRQLVAAHARDRSVDLVIVRDHRQHQLTLRW